MTTVTSNVFFYGLFMEISVLGASGVHVDEARRGVVRDWALVIGERATIIPARGESVWGMIMSVPLPDLDRLYSATTVRMYRPVAVLAQTVAAEGGAVAALTYVLPKRVQQDNPNLEYASKLRILAERLGLPRDYTNSIA